MTRLWLSKTAKNSRRSHLHVDQLEDRTVPTLLNMYIFGGSLALSGSVQHPLGSSTITQQGSGSLVTSYIGQIFTDYNESARTLAIDFNSYGIANNSGNWQPNINGGGGSAPANYGGQVSIPLVGTGRAAVRELIVGAGTVAPLPLTAVAVGFSFPSTQYLGTYYGFADYNAPIAGSGRANLAGSFAVNTAAAGAFIDYGPFGYADYYFLRMPVSLTINQDLGSGIAATLRIQGTIEAWAFPGGAGPVGGSGADQTPTGDAALGYLATAETVLTSFVVPSTALAQDNLTGVAATEQRPIAGAESQTVEVASARPQTALEQVFTDLLDNELVIA